MDNITSFSVKPDDTLCLLTSYRPRINKAQERIINDYNTGIILSVKIWIIVMYDYAIQYSSTCNNISFKIMRFTSYKYITEERGKERVRSADGKV